MLDHFLKLIFEYSICIGPTFILAVLISAILSEIIPKHFFEKILGKSSFISILTSSIAGALIPLCACGMIPLATRLQKNGASWLIVISFLTAGNACSITAILLTLVLGLKITLLRLVFSILLGIITAYLFVLLNIKTLKSIQIKNNEHKHDEDSYKQTLIKRIFFEFVSLITSYGIWIIVAIIFATIISLFISEKFVLDLAGIKNIFSPILFSIIGFPFYFCAGSEIPISQALLEKGASTGSVLAFMASSGGVNITSFLIYQKWLGRQCAIIYLIISALVCSGMGILVNLIFG